MNAYAIKPEQPFVTKKKLERTPASQANKDMVNYLETHTFSLYEDKDTGELVSQVVKKDEV